MTKENRLDVDKKQLNILKAIIKQHIPNKSVWVYGSRVTWKASATSDLDLAVFACTDSQIFELKEALEESDLLFSVDVMNWEEIPENFRTNIKNKHMVLQEKRELEGWRKYRFSEFVQINPQVKLQSGQEYPFVEMKDLNENRKKAHSSQMRKLKGGGRFINGDTLFARITPCLENGKICQVDKLKNEQGFGSTEFLVFRGQNKVSHSNFIYYLSRWQEVRSFAVLNMSGTSGRQRVSKDALDELVLTLPSLPEQKAIAEILSSLDDKIDLLHRQNKTLEDMAQALFRKWFIDEADDDWEVGNLGDIIENFDSKRIPVSKMKRDKMNKGEMYPYYGAAQIMDYVNGYIFDGEYILMAEDGTVKTDSGYPVLQYAKGKFWANNHTHVLKAKTPYNNFFIWHFLLKLNIKNIITGAVQSKINQGNLNSIPFPKYPLSLVNKFQKQVKPMFEKTISNQSQINTLENLRDTLLPKLMRGEINVKSRRDDTFVAK